MSDRDEQNTPESPFVDEATLARLFDGYRPRLWRLVQFRLDSHLLGRVDPDDVLQEAWLNIASRAEHYATKWIGSTFVWMRLVVTQTLIDVHRRHVDSQKRDAGREQLLGGWSPDSTSCSLAEHFLGHMTSPSQAVMREELSKQLGAALTTLSDLDQEVLALRHFEELSNSETAEVLNLTEQAASLRYVRALSRLKHVLEKLPEFAEWQRGGETGD